MATLRSKTVTSVTNENRILGKNKTLRNVVGVRKPLRGADNVRNISTKASFNEKNRLPVNDIKNAKLKAVGVKLQPAVTAKVQTLQDAKECTEVIESFSSLQIPDDITNIDIEDANNPQLVSRFVNDIYSYIRKLELKFTIKQHHLQIQTDITGKMRAVLIDWLIQVQLRFKLLQETLYMAISILDRYLQCEKVKRSQLQLAGVTAMFIAAKYEEMYAPDVGDFVYITDNTYSKKDILGMEKKILRSLDFNLGRPLPLHFLRRNSKAANVDASIHAVAKYLIELTLVEYEFACCLPSMLAAASLYISLRILKDDPEPWSQTLQFYSSYKEEDIMPIVRRLCRVVINSEKSKLQAVRVKYSSAKMSKISTIPQLTSSIVHELAAIK